MAESVGEIFYDGFMVEMDLPAKEILPYQFAVMPNARPCWEAGAKTLALHVLEVAAPTSPILTAMKAGLSFEDAVQHGPTLVPSSEPCRDGCTVACEATPDHAQRRLDARKKFLEEFKREERERMEAAVKRIDEPSEAEMEGAIGEIFAGITGEKLAPECPVCTAIGRPTHIGCPNAGPAKVVGVPLGHTIEVLRADHAETLSALAASEKPVLSGEAEQAFIDRAQEEGLQYAAENYPVNDPALGRLVDAYNAAGEALRKACGL